MVYFNRYLLDIFNSLENFVILKLKTWGLLLYEICDNFNDVNCKLEKNKSLDEFCFIEMLCSIGARDDLENQQQQLGTKRISRNI